MSGLFVMRSSLNDTVSRWVQLFCLQVTQSEGGFFPQSMSHAVFTISAVTGRSGCLIIIPPAFTSAAASSFSFCRPAVEYRALPEDFKHQLSRRTGGNLTWHDGRGQKTAGGRTVKLLQQPGTEALQVLNIYTTSICRTAHPGLSPGLSTFSKVREMCWLQKKLCSKPELIFDKKSTCIPGVCSTRIVIECHRKES